MKWYHYVACFFAGMFIANTIPHLVQGVSGDFFPSPFANPPGKGLSSPTINVFWGLFNLLIGYILIRAGKLSQQKITTLLIFFAGIICMSIMLSLTFVNKLH